MRSDTIKKGFTRAPHRALLRATGQIRDASDFAKPFIAVCNSYTDIVPGHVHLPTTTRRPTEAGQPSPFQWQADGFADDDVAA